MYKVIISVTITYYLLLITLVTLSFFELFNLSSKENPTTSAPTQGPTRAPTTRAPITQAPTQGPTRAPITQAPTQAPTRAPITQSPTTRAPTTQAPTQGPTRAPTTQAPTQGPTRAPTTQAPTTQAPTQGPTRAPTTQAPTQGPTRAPTTQAPTTQAPTIEIEPCLLTANSQNYTQVCFPEDNDGNTGSNYVILTTEIIEMLKEVFNTSRIYKINTGNEIAEPGDISLVKIDVPITNPGTKSEELLKRFIQIIGSRMVFVNIFILDLTYEPPFTAFIYLYTIQNPFVNKQIFSIWNNEFTEIIFTYYPEIIDDNKCIVFSDCSTSAPTTRAPTLVPTTRAPTTNAPTTNAPTLAPTIIDIIRQECIDSGDLFNGCNFSICQFPKKIFWKSGNYLYVSFKLNRNVIGDFALCGISNNDLIPSSVKWRILEAGIKIRFIMYDNNNNILYDIQAETSFFNTKREFEVLVINNMLYIVTNGTIEEFDLSNTGMGFNNTEEFNNWPDILTDNANYFDYCYVCNAICCSTTQAPTNSPTTSAPTLAPISNPVDIIRQECINNGLFNGCNFAIVSFPNKVIWNSANYLYVSIKLNSNISGGFSFCGIGNTASSPTTYKWLMRGAGVEGRLRFLMYTGDGNNIPIYDKIAQETYYDTERELEVLVINNMLYLVTNGIVEEFDLSNTGMGFNSSGDFNNWPDIIIENNQQYLDYCYLCNATCGNTPTSAPTTEPPITQAPTIAPSSLFIGTGSVPIGTADLSPPETVIGGVNSPINFFIENSGIGINYNNNGRFNIGDGKIYQVSYSVTNRTSTTIQIFDNFSGIPITKFSPQIGFGTTTILINASDIPHPTDKQFFFRVITSDSTFDGFIRITVGIANNPESTTFAPTFAPTIQSTTFASTFAPTIQSTTFAPISTTQVGNICFDTINNLCLYFESSCIVPNYDSINDLSNLNNIIDDDTYNNFIEPNINIDLYDLYGTIPGKNNFTFYLNFLTPLNIIDEILESIDSSNTNLLVVINKISFNENVSTNGVFSGISYIQIEFLSSSDWSGLTYDNLIDIIDTNFFNFKAYKNINNINLIADSEDMVC